MKEIRRISFEPPQGRRGPSGPSGPERIQKGDDILRYDESRPIDVICQHKTDGSIIPIKIKLQDEDGEFQIFRISAFRPLIEGGVHVMPNGVKMGNHIWSYECRIHVFGALRTVFLIYNTNDGKWICKGGS